MPVLVGFGYDVHRLVVGRPLVLGGLSIPFDQGLDGHSDADVMLHALMDALLGAAGLRDIGHLFPPSDPVYKDADSMDLLVTVVERLKEEGLEPVNADMTLLAEAPRIGPYVEEMRRRISLVLGVEPRRIGVKATTNEGLGFVGRGEGMAAYAVALVRPITS